MSFMHEFPHTTQFDSDLRQIIDMYFQLKGLPASFEELNEKFEGLKVYVNEYFKNLDVQDEINIKLDEMLADGTLLNSLLPIVSVTQYGAKGDGNTDDTEAIQRAINSGKIVYFPKTNSAYIVKSSITINRDCFIYSSGATVRQGLITTNGMFNVVSGANLELDNLIIDTNNERLEFDTANNPANNPKGSGINITYGGDVVIRNSQFLNLMSYHIFCYRSNTLRVNNCNFNIVNCSNEVNLVFIYAVTNEKAIIDSCYFKGYNNEELWGKGVGGVLLSNVRNTEIKNNRFDYCGRDHSIEDHPVTDIYLYDHCYCVNIINNSFNNSRNDCIRDNGTNCLTIKNNIISNVKHSTQGIIAMLDREYASYALNCNIEGNLIYSSIVAYCIEIMTNRNGNLFNIVNNRLICGTSAIVYHGVSSSVIYVINNYANDRLVKGLTDVTNYRVHILGNKCSKTVFDDQNSTTLVAHVANNMCVNTADSFGLNCKCTLYAQNNIFNNVITGFNLSGSGSVYLLGNIVTGTNFKAGSGTYIGSGNFFNGAEV